MTPITADRLGIIGPGKAVYEQYRSSWAVYKHELPEWGKLRWEALAIWNQLALEMDTAERAAHQETQAKLDAAALEIRVAAAVIEQDGLVRIFRRGGNDSYTGKWEFPGGKSEPGESLADALRRELREELAVESEIGPELDHYQYKYAKRGPISLTFFAVKLLGSPEFLEHTESAWVKPEQLADYDLMNGDMRFVATRYVLTRQLAETQAISLHTIQQEIHKQVEVGATIYTDEGVAYADLNGLFFRAASVNHGAGEYARGPVNTNSIESVWAVLKRGIHGVYHHASPKHLSRYIDEFAWRLNEGDVKRHTLARLDSFVDAIVGKRLTYARLIA